MRRFMLLAALLCFLAVTVAPAGAQPSIFGPGGTLYVTTASVSVTQAATNIFSYQVPAGVAQGNYAPLHLVLGGVLTTTTGSNPLNIGCNYGGSTATISLVNGFSPPPSLTRAPWTLDVWVTGYPGAGTSTAITGSLQGRFAVGVPPGAIGANTFASEAVTNAQVDMTTSQGLSQTLVCAAQWSAASNTLVRTRGALIQGN